PPGRHPATTEQSVGESELRDLKRQLTEACAELESQQRDARDGQAERARLREEVEALTREREETHNLRRELAQIRKDLFQRYQERRTRLNKQPLAVRRAPLPLQARKQKLAPDAARLAESQQEWALREAGFEATREQLARERQLLEEQARK